MISIPYENLDFTQRPLSSVGGVSNYNVTQSIKYQVEINFSLTHNYGSSKNYWFQFSRLNDRQPNNPLTQYCPPYQESNLLYSNITGYDPDPYILQDKFNNTYDLFNNTLYYNDAITLSQIYNVTLNEIDFTNINEADIGVYDFSDEMFNLYCNNSELYYERDNPTLIAVSNSIVDSFDNPIEKARKIHNWVAGYLTYDSSMPAQEVGALEAYNTGRGDCSEYSSLMVTLLRIQNIPARKVTGYCISANPSTRPSVGQQWTFIANKYSSNFLGHAWVEYYVPNIGWIACDPTWQSSGYNYFNKIDYLRFNLNIGQWFSIPLLSDQSEFPNPCIVYQTPTNFDYTYQFKVTVLESNLLPSDDLFIFIVFIIIGVIIIVSLLAIVILVKKRRKQKKSYYD